MNNRKCHPMKLKAVEEILEDATETNALMYACLLAEITVQEFRNVPPERFVEIASKIAPIHLQRFGEVSTAIERLYFSRNKPYHTTRYVRKLAGHYAGNVVKWGRPDLYSPSLHELHL